MTLFAAEYISSWEQDLFKWYYSLIIHSKVIIVQVQIQSQVGKQTYSPTVIFGEVFTSLATHMARVINTLLSNK